MGDHHRGGAPALKFTGEINSDWEDGKFKPDAPDEQLYDLASDPSQTKNVVSEHSDIAARMKVCVTESQSQPRSRVAS